MWEQYREEYRALEVALGDYVDNLDKMDEKELGKAAQNIRQRIIDIGSHMQNSGRKDLFRTSDQIFEQFVEKVDEEIQGFEVGSEERNRAYLEALGSKMDDLRNILFKPI